MSKLHPTAAVAIAGAVVGAALTLGYLQRSARAESRPAEGDDDAWAALAHAALRQRARRPRQSYFRVTAVVSEDFSRRFVAGSHFCCPCAT
jgi:hypothetical protein